MLASIIGGWTSSTQINEENQPKGKYADFGRGSIGRGLRTRTVCGDQRGKDRRAKRAGPEPPCASTALAAPLRARRPRTQSAGDATARGYTAAGLSQTRGVATDAWRKMG